MSSDEESLNNGDQLILDAEDEPNNIENVQENEENIEVQRDEEGDNEAEAEKTTVKPKRVARNPLPKLNHETLKGPRGIAALESYFERVKFKGKGHEHQDLNVIMKTYEYWCHRLFPKFPFDTCIERLEKLGTKKPVQTHIKKIRYDLLIEDKPIVDSSDEENNVDGFVNIQNEEIDQQNQQFDQLLATRIQPAPAELNEEQLERIRLNKERAEKLKQERLKKIREKAQENLEISSQLPGTSGIDLDSQSTQSEVLNQDIQTITSEDVDFDLESNIKGKTTIRGSAVKKRSSKHVDDSDKPDAEESSNDITSFQRKSKKNNKLIHSDSDEDNLVTSQLGSSEKSTKVHSIEPPQSKNKSSRRRNVIESDDSDEEMEVVSQKEPDHNDTRKVDNNESHQEFEGNAADITKVITTSNSDEDDLVISQWGPNEKNTNMDDENSNGEPAQSKKKSSRRRNVIQSDEEMEEIYQKEPDHNDTPKVDKNESHQELESNSADVTKPVTTENGVDHISSDDNDQMGIVEEDTDLDSTENTRIKTKSDSIRDLENKENFSVDNIC